MEGNNFCTGDKVVHIKSMANMTIKKNYGSVSSCWREFQDIEVTNTHLVIDTYICSNDNLIKIGYNSKATQGVLF